MGHDDIQIRILADNRCGFSAQFQAGTREVPGAARRDRTPGSGRAGKGHHIHIRVADQASAGLAPSRKYVDHSRGKTGRSEEHTSELQTPMRISYAVFCLKKKKIKN